MFPITKDLIIKTFTEWGPVYEIYFDLLIEKIEKNDVFVSVLSFTEYPGQCCDVGTRVPGLYLKTDTEQFHFGTQIGSDGNKYATSAQKYVANKWYHFHIKQFQRFGKTVAENIVLIFYLSCVCLVF